MSGDRVLDAMSTANQRPALEVLPKKIKLSLVIARVEFQMEIKLNVTLDGYLDIRMS